MAGRRTARGPAPVIPSNALVASAVKYPGKVTQIYRGTTGWQTEAWRQYDICPELRFAAQYIGNALSRCTIKPGEVDDLGNVSLSEDPSIREALSLLFSGNDGQAQMLSTLGIHLTVVGEAYIVGRKDTNDPTGQKQIWEVIGVNEMTVNGRTWTIKYADNLQNVDLGEDDTVIRVWRPHPAKRVEADSPVRALLPVLTEIEYLTRHIFAQTTSRVAGAGVWVLPDSVEFPGVDSTKKAESFMNTVGLAMETSLKDPSSAASLVPIMVTVPADAVDKIKPPIHFWSNFDEAAVNTRRASMLRFCVGMDIPPEVIMGMTTGLSTSGGRGNGASHWTSWQIEEAAIKLHIEPLLEVICNAIIVGYLRDVSGNPKAALVTDTTALKLQPDRSKEAFTLAQMGKISDEALRRWNGMTEDDAPSDEEYKRFLFQKVSGGGLAPEQVGYAIRFLTGDQNFPAPEGPAKNADHQQQQPSLLDLPSPTGPPDMPSNSVDGLQMALVTAASEPLVLRALERAGNRLRNQGIKPPDVPAHEVYLHAHVNGSATRLLEDAWVMVPQVAQGMGVDTDRLTAVLNAYAENLLTQQMPHSREAMVRYLSLVGK